MSILSRIGRFLSKMSNTSEDEVNELSSQILSICNPDVPENSQLEMLKAIAEKNWIVQGHYDLLHARCRDGGYKDNTTCLTGLYIVAISNTIHSLLGADPTSGKHLSEKNYEQMRASGQLQKKRINWTNIDRGNLRIALEISFNIKAVWKACDSPQWELCRITELESWANDESDVTKSLRKLFLDDQ